MRPRWLASVEAQHNKSSQLRARADRLVTDALLLGTERDDYQSFDWRVIRATVCGILAIDGHPALGGVLLFTLRATYVGIGRMSAAFAHLNDFLDLPGTAEGPAVAD